MRKIILLLALLPILTATTCDEDSPCDGTQNNIKNDSLISIENPQAVYQTGDVLWINTVVNRYQVDNLTGQHKNLFDFDDKLGFNFEFIKASNFGQNFTIYLNADNSTVVKGDFINNQLILVPEGDNFVNKVGIKLLESGSYKIKNTYIQSFRATFNCYETTIESKMINSNNDGYYEFVVQ